MKKKVILLVNTGSPKKPTNKYVRKFLSQFLNDKFVIDLPYVFRKILVNLIIVPFRTPKSTKMYEKVWTENGSPLKIHLKNLTSKLQKKVSEDFIVLGATRYGKPSVKSELEKLKGSDIKSITIVPLFPHYATSTTESIKQHVLKTLEKLNFNTKINFIEQFYSEQEFIDVWSYLIQAYQPENFDHILFSYHGLPINQVQNIHPKHAYETCTCETKMPEHGKKCYKATCYETSRLLTKKLGISAEKYSNAFQSRFANNWLEPQTNNVLLDLLKKGKKKILIVTPSFVADCLETTYEIGMESKEIFMQNGGEKLTLVESLNDNDKWINALYEIIMNSQNK